MKTRDKNFFFVIAFSVYILCAPILSAANNIFPGETNKALVLKNEHASSDLSKKQSVARLAYLPVLGRERISQHLQKAEYEVSRYERTLPSGEISNYRAFNRNQNMNAYFTDKGVHILQNGKEAPTWHLEMTLSGYGYDGAMAPVQSVQPGAIMASGHRIEYRRGSLTEWYVNDKQGLEQGVTLSQPPANIGTGPLLVEWTVSGSLKPCLEQKGTEIAFCNTGGQTILHYSGLKAWDANGQSLSARLAVQSAGPEDLQSRISYVVDATGASYPILIDPVFTQAKKLLADDGAAYDYFGESVSISDDTLVVGSDESNGSGAGAAYIFARNQGGANNWGLVTKITASDGAAFDYFGISVSINGATVVVGAFYDDDKGTNSGSAYIFKRDQGGANQWGQVTKITASDGALGDWFGESVSISGDTVVVGASGDNGIGGFQTGAAYIFKRDQGGANQWGQVTKITASDSAADDYFGDSVSISGDTVVVGSDDSNRSAAGAAYIFTRDQGGTNQWGQVTKITASDGAADDYFGQSVSISNDTVVVGSEDSNRSAAGAAYIFTRNQGGGNQWGQVKKITASDGAAGDYFGWSVSISNNTVVVGATDNDDNGAAYIFTRDQGGVDNWGQEEKNTASDGAVGDYFGWSVSISDDTLVVGASDDDDNGIDSGSAYVFKSHQGLAMPWIPLLLLDD